MSLVRNYNPAGRLFVQVPSVLFGGVTYLRGAELPSMLPAKHRAMWASKKAAHVPPKSKVVAPVVVAADNRKQKRAERRAG